ncbi:hypothetical protein CTAYLR_000740 [Chrysophaeum taylorii]|uniref:RCC1-like domain-containing protein n=1 Tax=Chrysophaeum taylorii TaxID=2483200 RepID=A0AAD7UP79_9STRA|nr:hypothetical protein CTAYLR_000740 [Chrysophaeum taylorii]
MRRVGGFERRRFDQKRGLSTTARRVTLTWGEGNDGQLGHYPFERRGVLKTYWELVPRELEGLGPLRAIACGTNHTLAIDEAGEVWSWGKSDYGKCGHGGDGDVLKPKKIEALSGIEFESVACGEFHSAAVDVEGRLFTWGWGGTWLSGGGQLGHGDRESVDRPKIVASLDEGGYRVASVSCGEGHTLILTDDGEPLSCGAGEHGRNGNGSSRDVLAPEPIDFLDADTVTQLEAGSAFSLALTDTGLVYVWGRNDQGQLGLGAGLAMDVYSMEDTPRLVELPEDGGGAPGQALEAVHVAAGHSHAAAVGRDGLLYFWGMKAHLEPFAVRFDAQDRSPSKVFAGGNYTFAKADDGTFHSFGLGRTNCLGHGDRQGHAHPKHVHALDAFDVTRVSCGYRHIALLATEKINVPPPPPKVPPPPPQHPPP